MMCASAHAARVPEVECDGARAYQLGRPQDQSVRALAPLDLGALHLPVCWNPRFSRILVFGRRCRMRPRAQLGIAAARNLAAACVLKLIGTAVQVYSVIDFINTYARRSVRRE